MPYSRMLGLNNCFYFVLAAAARSRVCIATALSFLDRGIAKYVCLMGAVTDGRSTGIAQAGASRYGAC